MLHPIIVVLLASSLGLPAQTYKGPRPPKQDVPYLLHAQNLIEAEVSEAKEKEDKDEIVYTVPGESSSARTPLASPIFLLQAQNLQPERLQLYRFEVRNGQREVSFSKKKKKSTRPLMLTVTRLSNDNIYRLEAVDSLEKGEYSLTPEGSNQVFCFQVY